jgi:protein-tyrosine phosphatase
MKGGRLKHWVRKVPWAGVAALTLLLVVRMAGASAIGQATCEQTGDGTYRISFEGWSAKSNIAINGSLPLVFHCSSGKDRTGVMAALLLGALGVPQETIMSDFLLSNTYLVPDSKIPQLAADIQKRQGLAGPPDDDTVRIMSGGVHPQLMKSFFQMLDKKQMSFEAYLLDELQLTPKELAAVRKRLLEP